MAESVGTLAVQVCWIAPGAPVLVDLIVPEGTTLQSAIDKSGVLYAVSATDLATAKTGIFGKIKSPDTLLREGDRIEIYRPLIADPKQSRRQRADKKEATGHRIKISD
jgi:putative ubiquitin-RnfH superfamily antitoxin RatB of RatAB toxin-antitoxin module